MKTETDRLSRISEITLKLLRYCRVNNWAGYDPYDALNSPLFEQIPFLDSKLIRLVMIQSLKRSPINVRALLGIPRTQNPKALGIFLKACLKLFESGMLDDKELLIYLIDQIRKSRSEGNNRFCWGYSFPWQTRTILVPQGAPNLVCTAFVADALLDAYSMLENPSCLEMALSAAEYVFKDLYWEDKCSAGFSYPTPGQKVHIYNADLLGAALLCRAHYHERNDQFLDSALKVARYSSEKQNADGSWYYGEPDAAKWIDSFHTGYNLLTLYEIDKHLGKRDFSVNIEKGYSYYQDRFFLHDGTPKYYHNKLYPIDIHCAAQGIITFTALKNMQVQDPTMPDKLVDWTIRNMWDTRGFFYFQVLPIIKNRIPYMRWSQAWMLYALAFYLQTKQQEGYNG